MKNTTTNTFTTIPATLTKAYFLGLPSCLSLAKGKVASVSKKIIPVSHTKYSGCVGIRVAVANEWLNNNKMAENKMVELRMETFSVLYSRSLSICCENLK